MNLDMGFFIMMVSIGALVLSPIWLSVTFLLLWRQSIRSRLQFLGVSTLVLFCALSIAIGGVNLLADVGVNFFALSGNTCKSSVLLCRAFDFFYNSRVVFGIFVYLIFVVTLCTAMRFRKPRWFGFRING